MGADRMFVGGTGEGVMRWMAIWECGVGCDGRFEAEVVIPESHFAAAKCPKCKCFTYERGHEYPVGTLHIGDNLEFECKGDCL